jgi:hypothetical protein
MKKKKKTNWDTVAWTPFVEVEIPAIIGNVHVDPPVAMYANSRYQVTVYLHNGEPFGRIAHLSFKTHDRQARHDWRDMQRIKNEICGVNRDAVEIYPDEAHLVDAANQYHLWVFETYKLPFGFQSRLVSDAPYGASKQRPWPKNDRPADCMDAATYATQLDGLMAKAE